MLLTYLVTALSKGCGIFLIEMQIVHTKVIPGSPSISIDAKSRAKYDGAQKILSNLVNTSEQDDTDSETIRTK